MRCVRCIAIPAILTLACLAAGPPCPAPAAGPGPDAVLNCAAALRSVDAARRVIVVEKRGGGRAEFGVDDRETMIFKGMRTLTPGELTEGMQLDIDYRPAKGGAIPLATWVEVLPAGPGERSR